MPTRVPRLLSGVPPVVVALVLAHNLTFLVRYGAGAGVALASTGHGAAWNDAATLVVAAGALMLVAAALRLRHLSMVVRDLERRGRVAVPRPETALAPAILRLWLTIAPACAVLLVIQENLERASVGEPLPLLGVLYSSEYPVTIPVVALVALGIAVLAALFRLRFAALHRRLEQARTQRRRPSPRLPRHFVPHGGRGSLLGRRLAGRSPPLVA